MIGYPEVFTNVDYSRHNTRPLEYRDGVSLSLQRRNGNLRQTASVSGTPPVESLKVSMGMSVKRLMTESQKLTYRCNNSGRVKCCKITEFCLRPPELLDLIGNLGMYSTLFERSQKALSSDEMTTALRTPITQCKLIDCFGRHVTIKPKAARTVLVRLQAISQEDVQELGDELRTLRDHLIELLGRDNLLQSDSVFICKDPKVLLGKIPVAVYSLITPNKQTDFLLHVMLTIGEFHTEHDLRLAGSLKNSLVKAKLIGQGNSPYLLSLYVNHLTRRIITEVFPVMPITMKKIDDYIYKTYRLLTSVIVEQSIHLDELAPCLLTEVLAEKRGEIANLWRGKTSDHLDVILTGLPELSKTKADFMNATKLDPMRDFCPLREIPQFEDQSILSYREQRASVSLGVKAVNQYCRQFGDLTRTKNLLTTGIPGAGKTHVLLTQGLYAISQGLKVMATSLMAVRSLALGGIHMHKLFALEVGKYTNPFKLADLSIHKLRECIPTSSMAPQALSLMSLPLPLTIHLTAMLPDAKSNLKMMHLVLTVDVLVSVTSSSLLSKNGAAHA